LVSASADEELILQLTRRRRQVAEATFLCSNGAALAREKGVAKQTHQKHAGSWSVWMEFLHRIDYSFDPYLEVLSPTERIRFCGAFMHAVRRGDFGKKGVMGGTARTAVDHVAAHFVESGRVSPVINSSGKVTST
jgi:hypothetical protein